MYTYTHIDFVIPLSLKLKLIVKLKDFTRHSQEGFFKGQRMKFSS